MCEEAVDGGVDFLVLGPIYATPSKAPYGPPLTPEILRRARAICPLPILAIGGIDPDTGPGGHGRPAPTGWRRSRPSSPLPIRRWRPGTLLEAVAHAKGVE